MKAPAGQLPLFTLPADGRPDGRGPHGACDPASARRSAAPAPRPASRRRGGAGRRLRERALDVLGETLFPTRCAVCDAPGTPLCPGCAAALPYIDALLACPRCGAPFGRVQCTECNPVLLAPFGYEEPPWNAAASALVLTEQARRIVTVYKDQGERSLARPMAAIMARYVPPRWLRDRPAVAFVPATAAARRRRGFDHAERLARELSWAIGAEPAPLLDMPQRLDQRGLSRGARIGNMRESMAVLPGASVPRAVIVVDDVCTTGATLFAAAEALRKGGAEALYALTFARA
ncbi:ComF family protein [uncultured Adlercreutzia sp.]|uniref:ComF family protein n=1 Tax=uncultured Adlercreutzia sp. TaxID=875803 RepID=UPI002676F627|nr:phosphoribosyltransferase family protein [uncultured Adlercreutzia sp.]